MQLASSCEHSNLSHRLTYDKYLEWLQLLVAGNQNMVRIWAGGIYESDIFYDICDELGILVWQDFMFACGQVGAAFFFDTRSWMMIPFKYPAYDSFVDSVRLEAEHNVRRLRHHPSLVIWGSYPLSNLPSPLTHGAHVSAGNNEGTVARRRVTLVISSRSGIDYSLAESLSLELDYSDETSDFRNTNFPARYIYERVLPAVVSENSSVYYHRGSPYSGHGKPTTDQTYGDIHQWNVWHGTQEPWANWDKLAGRFVSEFGMWVLSRASTTLELAVLTDRISLKARIPQYSDRRFLDGR